MIKSIFYSRFHPEKGPTILHQIPAGLISLSNAPSSKRDESHSASRQRRSSSPSPSLSKPSYSQLDLRSESIQTSTGPPADTTTLFSFSSVSDYLIPRQEYRDACISVCVNGYRVIGYPVSIYGKQYARNEFIFNVAIVVDAEAEVSVWTGIVRRVAALLKEMEEAEGFLSKDESETAIEMSPVEKEINNPLHRRGSKVHALCEMILEDLNNYCECMIPLDSANTLNLKLFPLYPPPPKIANYHVPLLTVDLSTLADSTWDLTMQRVTPHINGVNSVGKIADLAETDTQLVRRAIIHLVYYGCCLLLDVFSFSASYAVTPSFGAFVADEEMKAECARYVAVAVAANTDDSATDIHMRGDEESDLNEQESSAAQQSSKNLEMSEVKRDHIVLLYASLRQGVPLRTWCLENKDKLIGVDVRRLISFGIIRGFLYRIHKYAVATSSSHSTEKRTANLNNAQNSRQRKAYEESLRRSSVSTVTDRTIFSEELLNEDLSRYLDGLHSFDEICSDLHTSDKPVISALKVRGDTQVIQR